MMNDDVVLVITICLSVAVTSCITFVHIEEYNLSTEYQNLHTKVKYIYQTLTLTKTFFFLIRRSSYVEIPKHLSLEIDTFEDLEIANCLAVKIDKIVNSKSKHHSTPDNRPSKKETATHMRNAAAKNTQLNEL